MQRIKTLLCCFLVVMGVVLCPIVASAEETNSISASLTADREAYEVGDEAVFTVAVTNVSNDVVQDVSYEITLPEGTEPIEGEQLSVNIGELSAGETFTDTVKAVVLAEGVPATGEVSTLVPLGLVFGGAGILLVAAFLRKRLAIGVFTLLAALALFGSVVVPGESAHAAEMTEGTASTTSVVQINGVKREATLLVTFVAPSLAGDSDEMNTMTRGEWIACLLDGTEADYVSDATVPYDDIAGHKYEAAIKSAHAYGILPDSNELFNPDGIATRDFVYSVAALASGLKTEGMELQAADAGYSEHPQLLAAAIEANLAALDENGNIRPRDSYDSADAETLVAKIVAFGTSNDEDKDEGTDVVYRNDVLVIDGYSDADGGYSFQTEESVVAGDKIALVPTDDGLDGAAGTVTSVSHEGTTTIVEIDQATMPGEIYRSIDINAQNLGIDPAEIELADGVEFDDAASMRRNARSQIDLPELKLKVTYPPKGGSEGNKNFSASVSVSTAPYINVDFKYDGLFGGLKRLDIGAGSESKIEGSVSAAVKDDVTIDLSKKPVKVPVTTGVSVDVNLALEISAEGEVSISASVDNSLGYRYVKGKENGAYGDTDIESSLNLDASARAGLNPYAALNVFGIRLADIGVAAGVAADGNLIVRDTGMVCNNVAMYAYADIAVGEHSDLLKCLDLSLTQELWNKKNSPYKASVHWENGEYVPECTYKAETVDPGEPGDSDDSTVTPADDFVYEVSSSGIYRIINYIGDNEQIVIPVEHEGRVIEEVFLNAGYPYDNEAFNNTVKSISFEEGSKIKYFYYDIQDSSEPAPDAQGLYDIDFSNATELTEITIRDSGTLRALDLSNLTKLEDVIYNGATARVSPFEGVVLKNNASLMSLMVDRAWNLVIPNLAEAPLLDTLVLRNDGLTQIDVSAAPNLAFLNVSENKLSHLDVSGNTKLQHLQCEQNMIVTLELPQNLDSLWCWENYLTELDIDVLRGIAQRGGSVHCQDNYLTNIEEIRHLTEEYDLSWTL